MEHLDDVVDCVEWMILIGKQGVVEELEMCLCYKMRENSHTIIR